VNTVLNISLQVLDRKTTTEQIGFAVILIEHCLEWVDDYARAVTNIPEKRIKLYVINVIKNTNKHFFYI